jgi:hypothetical protein
MLKNFQPRIREHIFGNIPDRIVELLLALAWYSVSDFFEVASIAFWISASLVVAAISLLYLRRHAYACVAVAVWLLFSAMVAISASAVILADQDKWHYRSTKAGSFFLAPASKVTFWLASAIWAEQNRIEITDCSHRKIAKLPLLPYPKVTAFAPDLPRSPFAFRRFPPARISELVLIASIDRKALNQDSQPEKWISVGGAFG